MSGRPKLPTFQRMTMLQPSDSAAAAPRQPILLPQPAQAARAASWRSARRRRRQRRDARTSCLEIKKPPAGDPAASRRRLPVRPPAPQIAGRPRRGRAAGELPSRQRCRPCPAAGASAAGSPPMARHNAADLARQRPCRSTPAVSSARIALPGPIRQRTRRERRSECRARRAGFERCAALPAVTADSCG